jgi:hypothetical protein
MKEPAMPREVTARSSSQDAYDRIEAALESAARFVPRERGEAMFRKWVPRRDRDIEGLAEDRMIAMAADAVLLAADLLLSQPSASGTTAFDRLAKNCTGAAPEEAAAIAALCKARFRLLRIEVIATADGWLTRDVLLDELLRIACPDLPPLASGSNLFGRVVHLGGEKFCFAGAITPLDAAAFMTARSHPAAGAQNLAAAARWAEAVYAHVVRNGTLDVPGLNRPADDADGSDLFEPGQDELRDLSLEWLDLADAAPDAELLQRTRQSADLATILDALAAAVLSRDAGRAEIAFAVERLLLVQLETVRRREASGAVTLTLNAVAGALDHAMRSRAWPQRVRTLFETLRAQVSGGRLADDPALERLVQRIQALRAKTVAQGCTEQEALAAAEKVAELLDRHGLSLNELEFRAQPCEGIGIQTNRRKTGPIDACIPAIAAFFDCRVWAERADGAPLRYIFFGLRGDVTAAQYLYEMVERAFETETDAFRASDIYFEMAGERRSANNSFQTGLAQGISDKLHAMRVARDAVMRSASGRDLVPVKAAMVNEEMEKLGLSLSRRVLSRGKRVLTDAFEAGQAAGQRFEFSPAITQAA